MSPRRFHCPRLSAGPVRLSPDESHHAVHVHRLKPGDTVELFDGAGNAATAR